MRTLGIRTGNLYRSFGRNHPESLTKINFGKNSIRGVIGSKLEYANIQNRGGQVKATPTTTKSGRKTYKMAQWFWWQYDLHKNDFFKRMALHVIKRGKISIKRTKYFDKSIDFYEKQLLNPELERILSLVIKELDNDLDRSIQFAINLLKDLATEIPETFQIALAENLIFRSANNKFNNPKTVTWVNGE